MSDRLQFESGQQEQWRELRDERGKLCARLDPIDLLLEIRRNHGTVIFDLRDHIEMLRGIAIEDNMC